MPQDTHHHPAAHQGDNHQPIGYGPQGYPGSYGHYANPYQYGYGEQPSIGQRTIRDYLMIVRERIWYVLLAVFVITTGLMLWNQNIEPTYRAEARFKILRGRINLGPGSMGGSNTDDKDRILDDRDFNTQLAAMRSVDIIKRVSRQLNQDERNEALAPFQKGNIFSGPLSPDEVIGQCRNITPERQSFMAVVQYTHPNKELAQKLANYFVQEIQRANNEETAQISDPLLEGLKIQNDQIKTDIDDLSKKRNDLIEKENLITITKEMPTAVAELNQLASAKEADKRSYEEATANWNQLVAYKAAGKPTSSIPFIARDERVLSMSQEIAKQEILLSGLLKKYTDKHPNVIQVQRQLEQAQAELAKATAEAENKLESMFRTSATNVENSVKRYEAKEAELTAQGKVRTMLENLEKDIRSKEDLYNSMIRTYETEKFKRNSGSASSIRLVDPASVSDKAVNKYPVVVLIAAGVFLGGIVGLGIVFLLAALDDRVKSTSDIEQFVGIPLLGVIPKISKLDNFKRARTVAGNTDRATTEAFHAIYSSLKVHDKASKAKAMLTTSTTPSEGKSFFTTNLAMTYAMHGEKVIVVDADLRLPNVGKSLQITGDAGITQYQAGMITLDEAIRKDVVPGMDVLPVGAACKNPTQVLNSKKFAAMIEELKGRYDRVFIDSPPVGAVSDALNLMPQVDGALYVVKFNTVKRKSIKGNLRRLKESKVPVYGAVLNQIGLHVANYYTATYDKAYNKYYHDTDPNAVEVKVS
jgi:succinoglycan biosynthesis transport protein ExoP